MAPLPGLLFQRDVELAAYLGNGPQVLGILVTVAFVAVADLVIALIVTFLPITLPFKIVLAMVAMACFYFGRKYYHNHKNGGAETPSMSSAESEALASGILKALGGKNNIVKVDYCATRLRFEVHSYASVDEAAAKAAGAEGVIRPAKNACQVVIKGDVQAVYDALRKQL